jgi:hypothetical protein
MANAPLLPPPLVIGRQRFWRLGGVRNFVAQVAGEPAPAPQPDDEHLIQARELRKMLGGVSDMWVWRHSRRAAQSAESPEAA